MKIRAHLACDEVFFVLRGAPRACVDFCDPTAVSRVMKHTQTLLIFDTLLLAGKGFIIGDIPKLFLGPVNIK